MWSLRAAPPIWPCLAVTCASAVVAAVLAIAGVVQAEPADPYDALPATPGTALSLLGHNVVVALWPLALVLAGWPSLRGAGLVGDVLVLSQLVSHGYVVGTLAGERPELWRYLPHLPVEWFALAAPAAAWCASRRGDLNPRAMVVVVGKCAAALGAAALIETYAVPVG